MLAIGRALMSSPRLLLLDEPTIGLSPVLVQEMARIIREIHERGVPVVLVEQNAELALTLADYAYVLEIGSVALHGPAPTSTRTSTCAAPISARDFPTPGRTQRHRAGLRSAAWTVQGRTRRGGSGAGTDPEGQAEPFTAAFVEW